MPVHSPRLRTLLEPLHAQDVKLVLAQLSYDYAERKQRILDAAQDALEECRKHKEASELRGLREEGLALARLRKLCSERWMDRETCREAVRAYEMELGRTRSPRQGPPRSADAFLEALEAHAPAQSKAARAVLHSIWRHHKDVSIRQLSQRPHAVELRFFLLSRGEPEHVELAKNPYVDFDFVPSGREDLSHAVQEAGIDVTLDFARQSVHVDFFGRDENRRGSRAGTRSAAQELFCLAVLTCATLVAAEGMNADGFYVALEPADRGTGRLKRFYEESFGLVPNLRGTQVGAPLPVVVSHCIHPPTSRTRL